jgi:hypothetical protein
MKELINNIVPHNVVSFDHTFNIRKRTKTMNKDSKTYDPDGKNAMFIMMDGNRQILYYQPTKDTSKKGVLSGLKSIKKTT